MENEHVFREEKQPDSKVVTVAKKNIASLFETVEPSKRRENILMRLSNYSWLTDMDLIQAGKVLEGVEQIDDLDTFTETVLEAYAPVISRIEADPAGFQREQQDEALSDKNERLNDLLHYHLDEDKNMHLHVFPNMLTDRPEQLRLLREGLRLAAEQLKAVDEVGMVYATSWIVAKNPALLEKLGFTIEGEIDEAERRSLFSGEDRPIARASISREDFIRLHSK